MCHSKLRQAEPGALKYQMRRKYRSVIYIVALSCYLLERTICRVVDHTARKVKRSLSGLLGSAPEGQGRERLKYWALRAVFLP